MVIVHPINMAMKITQHVGVARQRVRNTDLSPQPFWVHLLSAVVWINHYCCLSRDYVHNKFSGPEIQVLGMDISEFIFFSPWCKARSPSYEAPKMSKWLFNQRKRLVYMNSSCVPVLPHIAVQDKNAKSFSMVSRWREHLTIWETAYIPSTYFNKFTVCSF